MADISQLLEEDKRRIEGRLFSTTRCALGNKISFQRPMLRSAIYLQEVISPRERMTNWRKERKI